MGPWEITRQGRRGGFAPLNDMLHLKKRTNLSTTSFICEQGGQVNKIHVDAPSLVFRNCPERWLYCVKVLYLNLKTHRCYPHVYSLIDMK